VTNGADAIQRRKFGYLGFEDCFSVFVTSERADASKPDPAIFHAALAEAGVEAQDTVFVGDVLELDIAGANAAGMRSVWFDRPQQV
jgi:putative hydrolase of the HAD superfamily